MALRQKSWYILGTIPGKTRKWRKWRLTSPRITGDICVQILSNTGMWLTYWPFGNTLWRFNVVNPMMSTINSNMILKFSSHITGNTASTFRKPNRQCCLFLRSYKTHQHNLWATCKLIMTPHPRPVNKLSQMDFLRCALQHPLIFFIRVLHQQLSQNTFCVHFLTVILPTCKAHHNPEQNNLISPFVMHLVPVCNAKKL